MSSRPVICQHCREKFVRTEGNFIKDTKGYYHDTCHKTMLQERAGREDLLKYCYEILGKDMNPALIQKQLKQFVDKYHYTESGVKGTLYYLVEIKKMRLNPKMGIGIVPYYYTKARDYFTKLDDITDLPQFETIVITKQIIVHEQINKKRLNKTVDLEDLFKEGEI